MISLDFQKIKQASPTLAKVAAYTSAAVALATCKDTGLANQLLNTIGINGKANLEEILNFTEHTSGIAVGITSTYLTEQISKIGEKFNYGINVDLEKAIKEAINKALPELHLQLVEYYQNEDYKIFPVISDLFARLKHIKISELELDPELIQDVVQYNYDFFKSIFNKTYEAWDDTITKPISFPADFESAFCCGLVILVTKHFHEIIKSEDNKKARIAYFIYLLESNAQNNLKTSDQLTNIVQILDKIQILPETIQAMKDDVIALRKSVLYLIKPFKSSQIDQFYRYDKNENNHVHIQNTSGISVLWEFLDSSKFIKDDFSSVKKFYEGHAPSWSMIEKFTFKRDKLEYIINNLQLNSISIITSAGGEGKTTLLYQLGLYYFKNRKQVLYIFQPSGKVDLQTIIISKKSELVLLLDNADQVTNLRELIDVVYYSNNIKLVIAARKNEWYSYLKNKSDFRLVLKKATNDTEFTLGKLSLSEIARFSNIILNSELDLNLRKDKVINILNDKSNQFLLSKMLIIFKGKPLEAILEDVIYKITEWKHGFLALKALAIIILIELKADNNEAVTYCNEPFLKECLKSFSKKNLDSHYPIIKGYLSEEAHIQSSSSRVITRNPIISSIFYNKLFPLKNSLLDEYEVIEVIIHSAIKYNEAIAENLLNNIHKYYLKENFDLARRLYILAIDCGYIPHNIINWIKSEINLKNIGDYSQKYSARWLCKHIAERTNSVHVYELWASLEKKINNIGTYQLEYSARWICKTSAELTHNPNIYIYWANLEKEKNNIGDIDIENSLRWIYKQGIENSQNSILYKEWIDLEISQNNIGSLNIDYSARWLCSEALKKSHSSQIYLQWIMLEKKANNIGNYDSKYTALWLCKEAIGKISNESNEAVYLCWATLERDLGNIGDHNTKYSARWICKKAFNENISIAIAELWVNIEISVNNIGDYNIEYSARWICIASIDGFLHPHLYYIWAKLERDLGNIGDHNTKYSARWICKKAFNENISTVIVELWVNIEISVNNIGDYNIKYSARWICMASVDTINNAGIYLLWINLEKKARNIGNYNLPYTLRWICKRAAEQTRNPSVYISWANIEIERNNIGHPNFIHTTRWILRNAIENCPHLSLYSRWAKIEKRQKNIGDVDTKYTTRWLYKEGFENTKSYELLLSWLSLELDKKNDVDYKSLAYICRAYFNNNSISVEYTALLLSIWLILEYSHNNIGDINLKYTGKWLLNLFYNFCKMSTSFTGLVKSCEQYTDLEPYIYMYINSKSDFRDFKTWLENR